MSLETLSLLRAGKLAGATRLDLSCGLTEFPREIFSLADTLEVLNLGQNRLSELPDDLNRLTCLGVLFCTDNEFRHVPAVIGACPNLSMVAFKSNRVESVDEAALSEALRWLILTENQLTELPATMGRCTRLQKLMLAGNRLRHLPNEMAACKSLELIRLAANELTGLPAWLLALPKLSWLAFSGNPCSLAPDNASALSSIDWSELTLTDKLGEGASGVISKAGWQQAADATARPVAVKVFKGAMTSDGLPANEMAACIAAGNHTHLIEVLGKIENHPAGSQGLVMSLIDPAFTTLAGPPSLTSCTRDVYANDQHWSLAAVLRLVSGVADAARHLHARGLAHGDLYAHNLLCKPTGEALLGDFGAASFHGTLDETSRAALERIEVRALGVLMGELLDRVSVEEEDKGGVLPALRQLQARCCDGEVRARPSFEEVSAEFMRLGLEL